MTAPAISQDQVRTALLDLISGATGGSKAFGQKHDATGTPAATGYIHGPGGLFSLPGVDMDVFTTNLGTLPGLWNVLPVRGSRFMYPTFSVLTGVRPGTGAEPEEICDDAPVGGTMKAGNVYAPFGRYQRSTREISWTRLGQQNDRADPMDLMLVGGSMGSSPFAPDRQASLREPFDILQNEMAAVMYERAVELMRLLSDQFWYGSPANTPNPDGGYVEMVGLASLITTGHVDLATNTPLPSLDSDVKDFNYGLVSQQGEAIVTALTYLARYVRDIASRTGMNPVRWAFAMRETLFYELTAVWPCSYFTALCNFSNDQARLNLDSGDLIAQRDEMRNGRYLLIDGIRYPVVLDDAILEHTNTTNANVPSGQFSSDIFLVPLTVQGARPVTYLECYDWVDPSEAMPFFSEQALGIVKDGFWLETISRTNWCFKLQTIIQPRIVERCPWLAGRLRNVRYAPLQHTRDVFPDQPYWVNGGVQSRPGPSYYNWWE